VGPTLVSYYPDHTFIPAVSGLDLKDPYNTDVHSPDFIPLVIIAFRKKDGGISGCSKKAVTCAATTASGSRKKSGC
jgi:hypothetical protein